MSGEMYRGVPVPDGMRPNGDTVEAAWWRWGVQDATGRVLPLLEALTDDDACALGHHGYCQVHGGGAVDGRCANAAAREFLAGAVPGEVWRSTFVIDPYLYWCIPHRPALAVIRVRVADIHPSVEIQCVQCGKAAR